MRAGDFPAAFAVSDAVLAARDPALRDDPSLPYHERWVWDGRPFDGARVLVRCYHGLGDTIQFSRYLAPLRRRAAHVTLEVQPELAGLLQTLAGVDALHPFDPARPLPPSECDIEIMELAHALRMAPDPRARLAMRPAPGAAGRVGFCWQAGGWDKGRDVPAASLRPVAGLPGLHAVSLQRGPASAEAGVLGATDPLDGDMDLLRTAALVAGLDAVVTVDTMIAHLAGVLGRPAFVLLKHDPDWRWGDAGSAWYGTARAYRQDRPGEWGGAVQRLQAELAVSLVATLGAGGGS